MSRENPDWSATADGDASRAASDAVMAWADSEPVARFIVTRALRLIWANGAAKRVLDDGSILHRSGPGVRLADNALTAELVRVVSEADDTPRSWHLSHRDGEREMLFVTRRIGVDADMVSLMLQDVGDSFQPRWADFAGAFGLTPAEYRVALLLLDGLGAEAAAERLKLGSATVRTHVKRLYLKLDVSSREAMFRKLSGFRIL